MSKRRTLFELERNDVEGAVAVYLDTIADGTWKPETSGMLLMLQDDPTELCRRFEKLYDQGIQPKEDRK